MIKEHRRTFKVLRLAFDLGLVTLLYYALLGFTLHVANPWGLVLEHPDYHGRLPLLLSLCWAFAFLASGSYDRTRLSPSPGAAVATATRLLLLALLCFAFGLFAFKIQFLSRKFMAVYSLGCFLLLTVSKLLELRLLSTFRKLGFNTLSVLFVGGGPAMLALAKEFEARGEWGYRVLGWLGAKKAAGGPRYLGKTEKLAEIMRTRIVDELVVSLPSAGGGELEAALAQAAQSGVRVRVLLPQVSGWQAQLDPVGGVMDTLSLGRRDQRPYAHMLKAVLDMLGSLLLLLLLSPLLLLIGLGILATMGGPVFFKQKRAGMNGRVFNLYKFRTMVNGARGLQENLKGRNQMSGPVFKVKDDPRVTPLGRFLRKTSMDELPQLWKVLRGELSLVGPRPLAQYEARKVPAWAWRRFGVKPGITCLWQVSGRNNISFDGWMRLDLQYIDEWSPGLDLKILLKTLPAVLSSRGAY
jgi:exopolysaccharide biosynthesis polyprenyl glycosylphosphotransferase